MGKVNIKIEGDVMGMTWDDGLSADIRQIHLVYRGEVTKLRSEFNRVEKIDV